MKLFIITEVNSEGICGYAKESRPWIFETQEDAISYAYYLYMNQFTTALDERYLMDMDENPLDFESFQVNLLMDEYILIQYSDSHYQLEYFEQKPISAEDNIINEIKRAYLSQDIVMSELLRTYGVSAEVKRKLLKWSGDDEFMEVTKNGEVALKY